MTAKPKQNSSKKAALNQALRANLIKRKAQARAQIPASDQNDAPNQGNIRPQSDERGA